MLVTDSQLTILRPFRYNDNIELAKLANNKSIWNNLKDYIPFPYTAKDADYFIALTMKDDPQLNFAIEYRGALVGVIGLVPLKDVYKRSAEIGYWIGEPFWNHGIATYALKSMTEYGLENLQFVRIQAGVFEYNRASMRVLEKCNYIQEGIFVKSVWKNDQLWNEHKFAILK